MKNAIATLVLLALVACAGIGGWWYLNSSDKGHGQKPLNADTEIEGMLSPEKQTAIWDAEHVTFEIEHRMCKPFLKAWAAGDSNALAAFFRPECELQIPKDDENWNPIAKAPLQQTSRETSEDQLKSATPEGLIAQITDPIQGVTIDKKKLRVLKIHHLGDNDWQLEMLLSGSGKNTDGDSIQYQSESDVLLHIEDEKLLGTNPAIAAWKIKTEKTRVCNSTLMAEISDDLGLTELDIPDNWILGKGKTSQHNFQIAIEDFDGDHDFDISVMTLKGYRKILAYNDGKYEDVTESLGLELLDEDSKKRSVFSTAWIDIDNDGFPELISGSGLFKNEGGKKFTNITAKSLITFESEPMGINVVDYNNDGLLDLYVLYQRPFGRANGLGGQPEEAKWVDESDTGKDNQLFKNNGNGTFTELSELTNSSGGKRHTHAASWFFYDDDHFPDLYIANDFGKNSLLVSRENGSYFDDVSKDSGSDGFATSMGVVTGDVDNDGRSDIYVANMFSKMGRRIIAMVSDDDYEPEIYKQIQGSCAGNRLYCRNGDQFEDCSVDAGVNEVGWAWAPTMLDINSDGLLDLYSTAGFMSFERNKPDG